MPTWTALLAVAIKCAPSPPMGRAVGCAALLREDSNAGAACPRLRSPAVWARFAAEQCLHSACRVFTSRLRSFSTQRRPTLCLERSSDFTSNTRQRMVPHHFPYRNRDIGDTLWEGGVWHLHHWCLTSPSWVSDIFVMGVTAASVSDG